MWTLSLSTFVLLSGCSGLVIPDARICSVAGVMSAGMDCATTVSGKTETLNLDQSIAFLEPSTERGGAMCMSTEDFTKLKMLIEQACDRLGRACTREVKKNIETVSHRIDGLIATSKEKRKKK